MLTEPKFGRISSPTSSTDRSEYSDQELEKIAQLMLGEFKMYGYRNNAVRNFIFTFLAGWLFGQIFTIQPKTILNGPLQTTQQRR